MFTPAAGVVDTHIDNFSETCQTIQEIKSIFLCETMKILYGNAAWI
ncbi:hypothetical protein X971_2677 [Agrobacterium tumefaciens LBA4213 (Ach5)]|nr:hypothetical protein X971_2677 [Agrobacterium tumefaciens LBA4213 (Ach5)]